MPPPREDLLTRTTLPAEADPYYSGRTVEEDVAVCGADDTRTERILVNMHPGHPDSDVHFIDVDGVNPRTTYVNPDDDLYRRILTGTGGFVYERRGHTSSGATVPMGNGVLHLCRDDTEDSTGRYPVFVSDNSIINNTPANAVPLRRVPFEFRPSEIIAIVHELRREDGTAFRLPGDHYLVEPANHTQLSLMPDRSEISSIISMVERPDSPIAADRRAPMIAALRRMMEAENLQVDTMRNSTEMQERMLNNQWWMIGIMAAMQLPLIYVTLRQMGLTQGLDTFLSNIRRMPRMILSRDWSEWRRLTTERRTARFVPTLANVGTNLTALNAAGELRPVADPTTPEMAELIENRIFARSGAGSAIFEAPPGWGKEVLMRELARRNPGTIFIQLTPDQLMAGTMYRGTLEQRLKDIPAEIERALKRGERVILCVDEFHEAAVAGRSMEETRTLLERWKGPLARGEMRIVGFSTPAEMLKVRFVAGLYDNPADRAALEPWQRELVDQFEREGIRRNIELRALLNRFKVIDATPRPASDIVLILRDQIEYRRSIGMMNVEMSDAALEAIARYSESRRGHEGHIPRDAFRLFEGVIEAREKSTPEGEPIRVTVDTLHEYMRTHERALAVRFGVMEGNGSTPPPSEPRLVSDSTPTSDHDSTPRVDSDTSRRRSVDDMPSVDSDTSVSPSGDDSTPHVDSDSTPRTVDSPAENTPIAREFTEERFYEMITDRYFHDARFQNADGSLNSNAVPSARAIARLARNRWIAAGNAAGGVLPTVDVSGHIFPSETIIETAFRDITEATERARMVEADMLRRAFDGRREGLERRGTDDLRDSLREPGRRIFELATRR